MRPRNDVTTTQQTRRNDFRALFWLARRGSDAHQSINMPLRSVVIEAEPQRQNESTKTSFSVAQSISRGPAVLRNQNDSSDNRGEGQADDEVPPKSKLRVRTQLTNDTGGRGIDDKKEKWAHLKSPFWPI